MTIRRVATTRSAGHRVRRAAAPFGRCLVTRARALVFFLEPRTRVVRSRVLARSYFFLQPACEVLSQTCQTFLPKYYVGLADATAVVEEGGGGAAALASRAKALANRDEWSAAADAIPPSSHYRAPPSLNKTRSTKL